MLPLILIRLCWCWRRSKATGDKLIKKMYLIKLIYIVGLIILPGIILISCTGLSARQSKAIQSVDDGFTASTKTLRSITEEAYIRLKEKLSDPLTAEKAQCWFPKAELIKQFSGKLYSLLDSCAHLNVKTNPTDISSLVLKSLTGYKNTVLNVDPEIAGIFGSELSLLPDSSVLEELNDAALRKMILSKLKNSIANEENRLISFCNSKSIVYRDLVFEKSAVIVSQNAMHFKKGDELEIRAGVGNFSIAANPHVQFNNTTIQTDSEGQAIFRMKVNKEPGNYFMPVNIDYFSEDGARVKRLVKVQYTIDQ
jgi:hypothetical protein